MPSFRLIGLAVLAASGISSAALAAPSDRQFLAEAMKGDNSEIVLGSLARARATAPAVRSYGATLAADHSRAKAQVAVLARRQGVPVTSAIMPEARAERMKLQRLRGAAFDREFASYMVNDHHEDIAKFEEQARHGNGPVARLAEQQLPVLRKHLAMAERLDQRR
jgi:putative membrane protein